MKKAIDIIETVAKKTDRVILFHSASGKDSIALLDLISPYFKEVVCAYMYVVNIIRKTKCSQLFKRSDISYKTKRSLKNYFPERLKDNKKSIGNFYSLRCFFL